MSKSRVFQAAGAPWRALRAFVPETRGVAAVEFAFIAPLMVAFYVLTMEFTQALETSKKLARVAVQVGDLIAQQQAMTPIELDGIMKISAATLQPYKRTNPTIKVIAIQLSEDPAPTATVVWSRRYSGGVGTRDLAPGSPITVPESLATPGAFLLRTEATLDYQPVMAWSESAKSALKLGSLDQLDMSDRYYQTPRVTSSIACAGC